MKRFLLTAALIIALGHIMICPYISDAATLGPACGLLNGGATVKVQDVTVPASPVLIQDTTAIGVIELPYSATRSCYTYDITPTQGHDYMGIFTDESTPARVLAVYLMRYETYVDAAVSSAGGDSAATVWAYADRQITSAYTDEGTPRDMAGTGAGGGTTLLLPAMQAQVYTAFAQQGREVKVKRGDTKRVTFQIAGDWTTYSAVFGARKIPTDAAYFVGPITCVISSYDAVTASTLGYFDLTATHTAVSHTKAYAEIELQKDGEVQTGIEFPFTIAPDVVR